MFKLGNKCIVPSLFLAFNNYPASPGLSAELFTCLSLSPPQMASCASLTDTCTHTLHWGKGSSPLFHLLSSCSRSLHFHFCRSNRIERRKRERKSGAEGDKQGRQRASLSLFCLSHSRRSRLRKGPRGAEKRERKEERERGDEGEKSGDRARVLKTSQ